VWGSGHPDWAGAYREGRARRFRTKQAKVEKREKQDRKWQSGQKAYSAIGGAEG